jgi:hypothetical protein
MMNVILFVLSCLGYPFREQDNEKSILIILEKDKRVLLPERGFQRMNRNNKYKGPEEQGKPIQVLLFLLRIEPRNNTDDNIVLFFSFQ